jgi:hypothetical protein
VQSKCRASGHAHLDRYGFLRAGGILRGSLKVCRALSGAARTVRVR